MKKEIDYYGTEDNYIHLKFGTARKMYFFTDEFEENYKEFAEEYAKYGESGEFDENGLFGSTEELVNYVFDNNIPINWYFNFTDTPAESQEEIINWVNENK